MELPNTDRMTKKDFIIAYVLARSRALDGGFDMDGAITRAGNAYDRIEKLCK